MTEVLLLDTIAINVRSHRLLKQLLQENPRLEEIMRGSRNEIEALVGVRNWVVEDLKQRSAAYTFYKSKHPDRDDFEALEWKDFAAIRILDYIDNAGRTFSDLNLQGEIAVSDPVKTIWLAVTRGTGGAKPYFFEDMLRLFRQFSGESKLQTPGREQLEEWMERFPDGLDPRIVHLREENRRRIIETIIRRMDAGEIRSSRYRFDASLSDEEKYQKVLEWWKESTFHLSFAVRSPDLLNEMLGFSLDPDTMKVLHEAEARGIPFFVNPYYLSLLHVRVPYFAIGADLGIRHYVVYSRQLVEEFGSIVAWEKEDLVEPGKPNAAGWILPTKHNIHRRYPDVAILIPDTMGRACGGLCASCQRMHDFQNGHLNFNLDKLKPRESWKEKLQRLMDYFENDSQLRDILITGGDALMTGDKSLARILDAILNMAIRKRKANKKRPKDGKYAEMVRVRLGTRLPVYLPQRITPELAEVLRSFREQAGDAGIRQFIVQTHFESPMEVTPEAKEAVARLQEAGWMVINQHVLTTASSRRGHNAKLRRVLGDIGVVPYYTFTVKGYMENWHNFATNARAMQEQMEEKVHGRVPEELYDEIRELPDEPEKTAGRMTEMRKKIGLPFLATDRNVLNLPGVGKSLTFRVIGITRYGRRILEFDHDGTRDHSPIIEKMGKIVIVESKSISEYLDHLEDIGERISDYGNIYGYSIGVTEPRLPLYDYPEYDYEVTGEITNLELSLPAHKSRSRHRQ